jgi:hypothetical protein
MTEDSASGIVITDRPIDAPTLRALTARWFGDMVKLVVDIDRRVVAIGGELHADAEALLLDGGSRQSSLWGANYFPGAGPEHCLELTALINIRPAQGNRSMVVQDARVASALQAIVWELVGRGEPL